MTGPVERAEQPTKEVDDGNKGEEDVPEPDEEKDFLVEQISASRRK